MKLSIIIVTWNNSQTIEKCLESVKTIDLEKEIIVIDNYSSDSTPERLKAHPGIQIIQNSENKGYGTATNQGAKKAMGDFLLLLNPDTEIKKGAVELMTNFLEKNSKASVVGPKLLKPNGQVLNEAADFPNLTNQIILELKLQKFPFFKKLVYQKFDYSKTQEANHLMGAANLIRKELFNKLNGFDENFFLWFEDSDLLKRIKDKGGKIFFLAEAEVIHLGSESTKQLNFLKKQTIWNKSLIYYFSKHKGWVKLLLLIPFIILSYPAALVSYLVKK